MNTFDDIPIRRNTYSGNAFLPDNHISHTQRKSIKISSNRHYIQISFCDIRRQNPTRIIQTSLIRQSACQSSHKIIYIRSCIIRRLIRSPNGIRLAGQIAHQSMIPSSIGSIPMRQLRSTDTIGRTRCKQRISFSSKKGLS